MQQVYGRSGHRRPKSASRASYKSSGLAVSGSAAAAAVSSRSSRRCVDSQTICAFLPAHETKRRPASAARYPTSAYTDKTVTGTPYSYQPSKPRGSLSGAYKVRNTNPPPNPNDGGAAHMMYLRQQLAALRQNIGHHGRSSGANRPASATVRSSDGRSSSQSRHSSSQRTAQGAWSHHQSSNPYADHSQSNKQRSGSRPRSASTQRGAYTKQAEMTRSRSRTSSRPSSASSSSKQASAARATSSSRWAVRGVTSRTTEAQKDDMAVGFVKIAGVSRPHSPQAANDEAHQRPTAWPARNWNIAKAATQQAEGLRRPAVKPSNSSGRAAWAQPTAAAASKSPAGLDSSQSSSSGGFKYKPQARSSSRSRVESRKLANPRQAARSSSPPKSSAATPHKPESSSTKAVSPSTQETPQHTQDRTRLPSLTPRSAQVVEIPGPPTQPHERTDTDERQGTARSSRAHRAAAPDRPSSAKAKPIDVNYSQFFGKTLTSKTVQDASRSRLHSTDSNAAVLAYGASGDNPQGGLSKTLPSKGSQRDVERDSDPTRRNSAHDPKHVSSQVSRQQEDEAAAARLQREKAEEAKREALKRENSQKQAQRIKLGDQRDADEAAALIVAGSAGADASVQAAQRDKEVILKNRLKALVASPSFEGRASTDFYGFGKVLGQGSFGKVRLAWQRLAGTKVAIKSYEKSKMTEPQHWKRVQQEIKLMEKLNHPHIIQMLEMIDSPKRIHIVMEHAGGGNLCTYVKQRKRLPEPEARKIFIQLLLGVEYMHDLGIIHRDIKLENVLFDDDRNMKLVDFGFSVACRDPNKRLKIFCGTPSYMAPEIVQRQEYLGRPVDVWSLGVLLYACLCGCFPFTAKSYPELYKKIAAAQLRFPDHLSHASQNLLRRMLHPDPTKRLSLARIRRHPWAAPVAASAIRAISAPKDDALIVADEASEDLIDAALDKMEEIGCDRDSVVSSVLAKAKNAYTTTYYLLLARYGRTALKSMPAQSSIVDAPISQPSTGTLASNPRPSSALPSQRPAAPAVERPASATVRQSSSANKAPVSDGRLLIGSDARQRADFAHIANWYNKQGGRHSNTSTSDRARTMRPSSAHPRTGGSNIGSYLRRVQANAASSRS